MVYMSRLLRTYVGDLKQTVCLVSLSNFHGQSKTDGLLGLPFWLLWVT